MVTTIKRPLNILLGPFFCPGVYVYATVCKEPMSVALMLELVVLFSSEFHMRVCLFSAVAFHGGMACFNGGGSLLQRSGLWPDAMV